MVNRERYERHRQSVQNAGKPLGGGLDLGPTARGGSAVVSGTVVEKPVEQGGRRGLRVSCRVDARQLGGAKLVLEITLHEQGRGPLRVAAVTPSPSPSAGMSDSLGNASQFVVLTPPGDEAASFEHGAFFPFEAIEVEREGAIACFARVRVLASERGLLAEAEQAFGLVAG
jgi:hypothetical protein